MDPCKRNSTECKLFQSRNFCRSFLVRSQKLCRSLDITRQVNERKLLNIIFRTHLVYLVLLVVYHFLEGKLLSIRVKTAEKEHQHQEKFWIGGGFLAWTVLAALKCIVLLGLARKPNQTQLKLRFYLRWYTFWNVATFPITVIVIFTMKIWLLAPPEWTVVPVLSIVSMCVVVSFKGYMIMVVIRTYNRLGSYAIEKLIESKGKEDEENWPGLQHNSVRIPSAIDGNSSPKNSYYVGCLTGQVNSKSKAVEISNRLFRDKIISPLNISIDTSKFIGEGQFGTVFMGTLRRNCACHPKIGIAAKIVKNCEKGETLQMLLQEIKIAILASDHPNIVLFYGISSDASLNAQCAIITELCEMGSLEKFLVNNRHTFVNLLREQGNIIYKDQKLYINLDVHGTHSSLDLMRFAHQIAVGMDHLSSRKIIHADLAARNVLLTKDMTVKLCDFGMSRRLYGYQLYLSGVQNTNEEEKCLPWRWMSYEAIKDLKFSVKSDVWSYGIVLYEIFTLGAFPFENLTWSPDILEKIENGMRLERPAFATEEIYEVMKSCWSLDPQKRPTFKELRTILTNINAQQGKSVPLLTSTDTISSKK